MNLVLYDGECALCDRVVHFLLKTDRRRILAFTPLQGTTADSLSVRRSSGKKFHTIIFVRDYSFSGQRTFYKSDAVLEILKAIGGLWTLITFIRFVPRPIRDGVYDWIARNRSAWFGKYDNCKIPSPEMSGRFLP